jgi:hypothetical protein
MMRYVCTFIVGFMTAQAFAAPIPANRTVWSKYLEGDWKVTKYVFTEGGARDEKRMSALIGEKARFRAGNIEFAGEICDPAYFRSQTQPAMGYFLAGYHTHPQKLGLRKEQIQVVRTGCDNHSFDEFILLERNKLLLGVDDAILVLERRASR